MGVPLRILNITVVKRWPESLKAGCADGYGEAHYSIYIFLLSHVG